MLTKELEETLTFAVDEAVRRANEYVTLEHLLYALIDDKSARDILYNCGARLEEIGKDLEEYFDSLETLPEEHKQLPELTSTFQSTIQYASLQAEGSGQPRVDGGNILAAIFQAENSHAVYLLKTHGCYRVSDDPLQQENLFESKERIIPGRRDRLQMILNLGPTFRAVSRHDSLVVSMGKPAMQECRAPSFCFFFNPPRLSRPVSGHFLEFLLHPFGPQPAVAASLPTGRAPLLRREGYRTALGTRPCAVLACYRPGDESLCYSRTPLARRNVCDVGKVHESRRSAERQRTSADGTRRPRAAASVSGRRAATAVVEVRARRRAAGGFQ